MLKKSKVTFPKLCGYLAISTRIGTLNQGLANFFLKRQTVNILGLQATQSLLQRVSSATAAQKQSQMIHKQVSAPVSQDTLFTKAGSGLDLVHDCSLQTPTLDL